MSLTIYIGGSHNATHNLTPMWSKAGCYSVLYESHGKPAKEILSPLITGLTNMLKNSEEYRKLEPSNGWGDYDGAIEFLVRVIKDCASNPDTIIEVSS